VGNSGCEPAGGSEAGAAGGAGRTAYTCAGTHAAGVPTAVRAWIAAAFALVASGCATLPDGHGWGQDATLRPGWARVREAARNAATDPWVWAPLGIAAIVQIDDWDREIADWARAETPVFGSTVRAEQWSDDLRTASTVAYHVTALVTPSGSDPQQWLFNKARGYAVGLSAAAATRFVTGELKRAADRERPNGLASESFPSGHTSTSAVYTKLASRNLRSLDLSNGLRRALDLGLDGLVIGTSWSRIEAGWHFPSDTLFSMALGNFLGAFVNDAFLGLDPQTGLEIALLPERGGAQLRVALRY
jgi:membrane-associated phospholipid phosphatase